MTVSHHIVEKSRLVCTKWSGSIGDEDLLDGYRELYENPEWHPGFDEIVDLRSTDMTGVTSQGMQRLSRAVDEYVGGLDGKFKTAVIAPNDLPFGLARIYGVAAEGSTESVRVFRSEVDALDWVGVDKNTLSEIFASP